jgi:hypothetical protein
MWQKYSVLVYENGELRLTETTPGMEEGGRKENDGGDEFNYGIICKCHSVPQYNNNMLIKVFF